MATTTVYCSADNWLDNNQKTKKWNNQLGFVRTGDQGGGDGARSLFRFTMPADPLGGAVIDKIEFFGELTTNANYGTGVTTNVHEGVNTPSTSWVDSQSTWNNYSSGNSWTVAGAASDFDTTVIDSRVSAGASERGTYISWVLYGTGATNNITTDWGEQIDIMLRAPSSAGFQEDIMHMESAGTTSDPYIEITYSAAPTATFIPKVIFF